MTSAPPPDPASEPAPNEMPAATSVPAPNETPDQAAQAAFQRELFKKRVEKLLALHREAAANKPNPPMWGGIQTVFVLLACAAAYGAAEAIQGGAANQTIEEDIVLAVVSFGVFFAVLLLPDLLLKLYRIRERNSAWSALEDAVLAAVQAWPEEIERAGGVGVLADPVALKALRDLLESKEDVLSRTPGKEPPT